MSLIALMCISVGCYVLVSPFKVNQEICINDLADEKAETVKESIKEWIDFAIDESPVVHFRAVSKAQNGIENLEKLPSFINSPNTPPPDMSA